MRFIFLLVLLANIAVLGYGQGFFGQPPSERGREFRQLSERHQHSITVGVPIAGTAVQ